MINSGLSVVLCSLTLCRPNTGLPVVLRAMHLDSPSSIRPNDESGTEWLEFSMMLSKSTASTVKRRQRRLLVVKALGLSLRDTRLQLDEKLVIEILALVDDLQRSYRSSVRIASAGVTPRGSPLATMSLGQWLQINEHLMLVHPTRETHGAVTTAGQRANAGGRHGTLREQTVVFHELSLSRMRILLSFHFSQGRRKLTHWLRAAS